MDTFDDLKEFYNGLTKDQIAAVAMDRNKDLATILKIHPECVDTANNMMKAAVLSDHVLSVEEYNVYKPFRKELVNTLQSGYPDETSSTEPISSEKLVEEFKALPGIVSFVLMKLVVALLCVDGMTENEEAWVKQFF